MSYAVKVWPFFDRRKVFESAKSLVDQGDFRKAYELGTLPAQKGAFIEAIAVFESVAAYYAREGFELRAIAVYKDVLDLVLKRAPELREVALRATRALAAAYEHDERG